jgi:predicted ATP-grasp superfamily ATP-dependent carboligase
MQVCFGDAANDICDRPRRMPSHRAGAVPAIVLALDGTGLATAWALADAGVDVHAVSCAADDPGRHARRLRVVDLAGRASDGERLVEWLHGYARRLGNRPVVLPTSDPQALALARHRDRLAEVCRLGSMSHAELGRVVSKDRLYALGAEAGVDVPPGLIAPSPAALEQFCADHPGPYLAKPYYNGVDGCALGAKNRLFVDAASLLTYTRAHGTAALIVQQLLIGGDGWIYDAYGLCRRDGSIAVLASHRRIRQHPPDLGATSYGEIPAAPAGGTEEALFEPTRRLLAKIRYHGIFGVEWLQERATGRLFLLDFNARPFSSIGHLADCGLNLPLLCYRELMGDALADAAPARLERRRWVDLATDVRTARMQVAAGALSWSTWLGDVAVATSFARVHRRDPRPGLYLARELVDHSWRFAAQRLFAAVRRARRTEIGP